MPFEGARVRVTQCRCACGLLQVDLERAHCNFELWYVCMYVFFFSRTHVRVVKVEAKYRPTVRATMQMHMVRVVRGACLMAHPV